MNNSDKKQNVSFHNFQEKIKCFIINWVSQVKWPRAEWNGHTFTYTYVCSEHFTVDCFERKPQPMLEMGLQDQTVRVLKPDAVPTIFPRKLYDHALPTKFSCTAFEKKGKD